MIEGLLDLIKEQVRPADMPMFFWEHLVHDIHMLSTAIGKSRDDSCLVMHLILKNIASQNTAIRKDPIDVLQLLVLCCYYFQLLLLGLIQENIELNGKDVSQTLLLSLC